MNISVNISMNIPNDINNIHDQLGHNVVAKIFGVDFIAAATALITYILPASQHTAITRPEKNKLTGTSDILPDTGIPDTGILDTGILDTITDNLCSRRACSTYRYGAELDPS